MLRRGGAGRFGTKSDIDGVERLYAYRQLADYPLFVVVGLAEEEAMRAYQDSRSQAIAMGVFGTAGILAATVVLLLLISRVERSRALAEQASRSKSEFLANMSHELRTPLNGILGYSELLKEDLRDQPQAEFAEAIHDSGAHLLAIVNDVLDMSKVESGHVEVEKSPDSPVRLLQQAVGGHQASASRKGLALAAAVGPRVPESAMLDRTKVLRILNNLLHNAVKFTEKGGVDASVEVRGLEIVFSVRDTGPGIPVDLQEAIFGKFMQGDSSLSKRHEGTGLGLALCSDLARIMGGRVWLMSRPGEGSTFFLAVPLEPVEAAHKEHALA
jgi:two-component system, NarL family, sensor histidine kinase BarA